jgi:ComF family protein
LLDYLYRPRCAGCDQDVAGAGMCQSCYDTLVRPQVSCPRCALPIAGPVSLTCARCAADRGPLKRLTAAFEYGGQLAEALKRLKYGRRSDVARALAPLLRESFERASSGADLLLAVPLHRRRLARRGYNQAARLLHHLAPPGCAPASGLQRVRPTREQASLPASRRRDNVAGAFRADPAVVARRRVLLVDDIVTTGNTMRSAADALQAAGATLVTGFCAARATM